MLDASRTLLAEVLYGFHHHRLFLHTSPNSSPSVHQNCSKLGANGRRRWTGAFIGNRFLSAVTIPRQGPSRKGSGYLPGTQRGRKGAGSHGSLSEGVGYLQVVQFFGVKISQILKNLAKNFFLTKKKRQKFSARFAREEFWDLWFWGLPGTYFLGGRVGTSRYLRLKGAGDFDFCLKRGGTQ